MLDSTKLKDVYADHDWIVMSSIHNCTMSAPEDDLILTVDPQHSAITLKRGQTQWTLGSWNDRTSRYKLWDARAVRSDEMMRLLSELARTPAQFLQRLNV